LPSFFNTRILPVRSSQFAVSEGSQLGGEVAVVNIDSKNREETHDDRARAGARFAGVSAMHPSLLWVASISLIVGAAETSALPRLMTL
jgi:hypothetical protein